MKVFEKYQELKKTFELPPFEDINSEFEIVNIERLEFLMREIRRRMCEKMEFYAKQLEEYLQPDGSFSNLLELKNLTEDQKKGIFDTYRKLMTLLRKASKVDLAVDDKKDAEYIKNTLSEWKSIRESVANTISSVLKNWQEDVEEKDIQNYFG